MAYVPPHKRQSKDYAEGSSSPRPELLSPLSSKNLKLSSLSPKNVSAQRNTKSFYPHKTVWRWLAVGLDDRNQFPSSVRLQPVSFESVDLKVGEKSLALIYTDLDEESSGEREGILGSPWVFIAENVIKDLLSSFERVRNEMESSGNEEVRSTLVARFGKIIFRGISSLNQVESMTKDLVCEGALRQLKRSFNTSIPKSYMEYILEEGAQKIGVEFERDKDVYHVKLLDATQPGSTISCKCKVLGEAGKLQLYKIERSRERHMVTDISCLERNVDLRLMLYTKRIINDLTDDDMQSIRNLIDSAVIDTRVKGGLRWSLGKATSGDKFSVVGAYHTTAKTYVNSSMRLKVRVANRFHFMTSTGEFSREIIVKLKNVASALKEQEVDEKLIKEILKDNLRVLWESFFRCESFLKW